MSFGSVGRLVRAMVVLVLAGPALGDDGLHVRVVDVGAGLCCVVAAPGDHYMVYDAGNYEDKGATAKAAIEEMIPDGKTIDLLVLSHSDSDHVAAVPWICQNYRVKRVIRPGIDRDSATWKKAVAAIHKEEDDDGCDDVDLSLVHPKRGKFYRLGEAKAYFVCGFSEPPSGWEIESDGERNNAGSIVIRLEYQNKSILFTGDTVGRHIDDPDDACIDAEKLMVDGAGTVKITSDVLIAPHHGANNGSSRDFIAAVKPTWVVFSAGHKFSHPRKAAAQRYLDAGIKPDHMLRTDRGDDEGSKEWSGGRQAGSEDPKGDDDVEIFVAPGGNLTVKYAEP